MAAQRTHAPDGDEADARGRLALQSASEAA